MTILFWIVFVYCIWVTSSRSAFYIRSKACLTPDILWAAALPCLSPRTCETENFGALFIPKLCWS